MITKYIQHNKGFTLVETLVAVAILMIAIAGPLTIANQALTAALGSRNAMVATYLAQEGVESIKNIKDNNVAKNGPNSFGQNIVGGSCTSNLPCAIPDAIGNILGTPSTITNCNLISPSADCSLYTDDSSLAYVYLNSGSNSRKTPFVRFYYITNNTASEFIVTVVVKWNDGAIPNEVRLQELMTNASRG